MQKDEDNVYELFYSLKTALLKNLKRLNEKKSLKILIVGLNKFKLDFL
jgi:hypothetical protein